ncbi:MAG: hypothetical protein FRX49_06704 [Trebouxia sp. A1-2]|nr:MAG: hypothetical protein FRX49_06704 [Trebouxia sp. A1-2]
MHNGAYAMAVQQDMPILAGRPTLDWTTAGHLLAQLSGGRLNAVDKFAHLEAGIICLQAPDFRLQASNLSRELGILQKH